MVDPKIISWTSVKGVVETFLQIREIVLKWEQDKLWGGIPS